MSIGILSLADLTDALNCSTLPGLSLKTPFLHRSKDVQLDLGLGTEPNTSILFSEKNFSQPFKMNKTHGIIRPICYFNKDKTGFDIHTSTIHIDHYNTSIRIIDLVSHTTYVVCIHFIRK